MSTPAAPPPEASCEQTMTPLASECLAIVETLPEPERAAVAIALSIFARGQPEREQVTEAERDAEHERWLPLHKRLAAGPS